MIVEKAILWIVLIYKESSDKTEKKVYGIKVAIQNYGIKH